MIATRKTRKPALLGAVLAALALPAGAAAEYYVPPANSAANQYTETLPSAGGDKGGKDKGGGAVKPADTLGARNAERLEGEGPTGKAAAQLAAETAPPVHSTSSPSGSPDGTEGESGGGHKPGGGKPQGGGQPTGDGGGAGSSPVHADQPSGSSALGEIVRQATGSGDDGNLGLWLPLAILVTLVGSIAYGVRHRHDRTA